MAAMLARHARLGCTDTIFPAHTERRPRWLNSKCTLPSSVSQASVVCVILSVCAVLIAAILHEKLSIFLCEVFPLPLSVVASCQCDPLRSLLGSLVFLASGMTHPDTCVVVVALRHVCGHDLRTRTGCLLLTEREFDGACAASR